MANKNNLINAERLIIKGLIGVPLSNDERTLIDKISIKNKKSLLKNLGNPNNIEGTKAKVLTIISEERVKIFANVPDSDIDLMDACTIIDGYEAKGYAYLKKIQGNNE
jgi:hypothetical protein